LQDANGDGVVHAASILNGLWRWGRPAERAHLERAALGVLDGLVQLLYNGTARGKEHAAAALGTFGQMSAIHPSTTSLPCSHALGLQLVSLKVTL
jgi:hypothetical protein